MEENPLEVRKENQLAQYNYLKQKYEDLHLVSFDYGQRHKKELECAASAIAGFGATGI